MTEELPAAPSLRGVILFVLAATAILCLAFLSRFNGYRVYDNAYLYVRYADHLIAGQGMVWNVGDGPVYGVRSLAYLLGVIPFRLLFPANPTAAIFASSFFWGMMFLALLFRLAIREMQPSRSQKPFAMGLVMVALIATAVSLRGHFASGMETMMVLCYLTGTISLLERLRRGGAAPRPRLIWGASALLGMAWWVRPDMVIFTVGIPWAMVLLVGEKAERRNWIKIILLSLGGLVLSMGGAKLLTGDWVPLSFFAHPKWLFAPAHLAALRATSNAEAMLFLGHNWPLLMVIGMGIFLKWGRLGAAYSALDKAIFVVLGIFALYSRLFVWQEMGMGERYYYPLFPFLVYLALRELWEVETNLRLGHGLQFKRIPRNLERGGLVALACMLLYYGIDYGRALPRAQPADRFAVFDTERIYREGLQGYWAELDALQELPRPLRIAATEVGMPAALYPDYTIDDLVGLQAPAFLHDGLSASAVLTHCPADLIYLPHPQFAQLHHSLRNSPEFAAQYTTLSAEAVGATLAVSIRKDSPYAQQLLQIFGK